MLLARARTCSEAVSSLGGTRLDDQCQIDRPSCSIVHLVTEGELVLEVDGQSLTMTAGDMRSCPRVPVT